MSVSGPPDQNQFRHQLSDECERLRHVLQFYVTRMGLATVQTAMAEADELLGEVVIEALEHIERFDPSRLLVPWLLGIAANLIRRKQIERGNLDRREPLIRDLYLADDNDSSDDDLFDRLTETAAVDDSADEALDITAEVATLLTRALPADQYMLRLAIQCGMDGERLAQALDITPNAARVRLHRAIRRLRMTQEAQKIAEPMQDAK